MTNRWIAVGAAAAVLAILASGIMATVLTTRDRSAVHQPSAGGATPIASSPSKRPSALIPRTRSWSSSAVDFAQNAWWYDDVRTMAVDSRSAGVVGSIRQDANARQAIVETKNSPVVVNVGSEKRTIDVEYLDCGKSPAEDAEVRQTGAKHFLKVNIPSQFGAEEIGETFPIVSFVDREADPDGIASNGKGVLWEFQKFSITNSRFTACAGGRIDNLSGSDGIHVPGYGPTASGIAAVGGVLGVEEMKLAFVSGNYVLPHALALTVPKLAPGYVKPANSNAESAVSSISAPQVGMRLRLSATANCAQLANRVGRVICETAKVHGFVIISSADRVSVQAEDSFNLTTLPSRSPSPTFSSISSVSSTRFASPTPAPPAAKTSIKPVDNAWVSQGGLFGGATQAQIFDRFPWDQLELVCS